MERHGVVWLAKSIPDVISAHRRGTHYALLRRLANQHERALPFITPLRHDLSRPHQAGDMHIVPASVHHEYLITVGINLLGTRCVRESRLLLNWQTVHVGPKHHQRPLAIFQERNNPGTAYIAMHRVTERRQFICQSGGGLMLHR